LCFYIGALEHASKRNFFNCTEVVFFIHPQDLEGARKNVFRYDGSASGQMLYNWHRDYNPALERYTEFQRKPWRPSGTIFLGS
jgi:hypothetical protein